MTFVSAITNVLFGQLKLKVMGNSEIRYATFEKKTFLLAEKYVSFKYRFFKIKRIYKKFESNM